MPDFTHDSATPKEISIATSRKLRNLFKPEEIKMLTVRSNAWGFWAIGSTWAIIAGALVLMAWASAHSLMIAIPAFIVGLCGIAGRQLCLAILMHDASHGTLFKSKWLNNVFADWTCARPIWNDVARYKMHHFMHHRKTATEDDPDMSLVTPYPCSRASMWRKILRDLTGRTGLKFIVGRFLMDAGYIRYTVASSVTRLPSEGVSIGDRVLLLIRNVWPTAITNAIIFFTLWASGFPLIYLTWLVAYITPFSLFVRIRSVAEHACLERTTDMFRNTRTTRAGFLARATVAPLRVNYHIEHHVMASVPYFRLRQMHRLLLERNAVAAPPSYLDVLRTASAKKTTWPN